MKLHAIARLGMLLGFGALQGCWFMWSPDDRAVPTPPIYDPDLSPPSAGFVMSRGCSPLNRAQCPLDARPLMTGVRETVSFSVPDNAYGGDPSVSVDDPSVVTVAGLRRTSGVGERYAGLFDLTAGASPGRTTLRVTGATGETWQWTIRVDAPAGMDIVDDEGAARFDRVQGRLALRVGEQVSLVGVPVNLEVERLYANDGVVWTVPNTRVVNLSWTYMQGPRVVDDRVFIDGVAPGQEEITVRAGVVERTVVVDVAR